MDARVDQFLQDAQRLARAQDGGKAAKEMERLRKFLFKNQEHRFTDREQAHLFEAVQVHASAALCSSPAPDPKGKDSDQSKSQDAALGLVEDALKMPFNVFGTAHKKAFLKWHSKMTGCDAEGGQAGSQQPAGSLCCGQTKLLVIDAGADKVTLMAPDGETRDIEAAGDAERLQVIRSIQQLFREKDEVQVWVEGGFPTSSSLKLASIVGL